MNNTNIQGLSESLEKKNIYIFFKKIKHGNHYLITELLYITIMTSTASNRLHIINTMLFKVQHMKL